HIQVHDVRAGSAQQEARLPNGLDVDRIGVRSVRAAGYDERDDMWNDLLNSLPTPIVLEGEGVHVLTVHGGVADGDIVLHCHVSADQRQGDQAASTCAAVAPNGIGLVSS